MVGVEPKQDDQTAEQFIMFCLRYFIKTKNIVQNKIVIVFRQLVHYSTKYPEMYFKNVIYGNCNLAAFSYRLVPLIFRHTSVAIPNKGWLVS